MFEEIEKFLDKKRKGKTPKKRKAPEKGVFQEDDEQEESHDDHSGHDHEVKIVNSLNELPRVIREKIKDAIKSGEHSGSFRIVEETIRVPKKSHSHFSEPARVLQAAKEAAELAEGLIMSLQNMGKKLKLKPYCSDGFGNPLKVGDFVSTYDRQDKKKVMELGYGFAELSNTEDEDMSDGFWTESQMKRREMKKL